MATDVVPACNICGGREFVPGPNGRLSPAGAPPQCGSCRSLERQRSLRACLLRVPEETLSSRRAIQFAPDGSLDSAWFRSLETSTYGGENSIDLQEIDRAADSYDFISLSSVLEFIPDDRRAFAELARIGSESCILHCMFCSSLGAPQSTHFGEPHGTFGRYHDYGADLEEWFATSRRGLTTLMVGGVDPVTGHTEPHHFFCRQGRDAKVLADSFTNSDPVCKVSIHATEAPDVG
jgi:hypothetical protein